MAKIYPRRPPQFILDDPKRSAELKVFSALKSLPDVYRVFYSINWQNCNVYDGVWEGEADFIIAHRDKGFIVLEVKGGRIHYHADIDQWYSQDREGILHDIKDPVNQARNSHYEIERRLKEIPGWPNRNFNIWHAVCFPDVWVKPSENLKPDLPREQVIDFHDLQNISQRIEDLFNYQFGSKIAVGAPGEMGILLAETLLGNSFELHTPLGVELERDDEKLVELTERQYLALSLLGNRKRVAIAGCAGSGKTMLAIKKVQQYCELDLNVLFVCFNSALADFLKTKLLDANVTTFHKLCQLAANKLGRNLSGNSDISKLFNEVFPETLMEFAEETGRIYDAIIVDEGQDFQDTYWIALESLLKPEGYLYIFFDDNQNIYHGSMDFGGLITDEPFHLNTNCRNTQLIHETVKQYHNNPIALDSVGPKGVEPEWISYKNDEEMKTTLRKVLHQLVNEENIRSQDIVILTPKGENKSIINPGTRLGNFSLTNRSSSQPTDIMVSSIQRFKGLEKRVVIISELDQIFFHDLDMLMYVGCSRARTHLVILHHDFLSQSLKKTTSQVKE